MHNKLLLVGPLSVRLNSTLLELQQGREEKAEEELLANSTLVHLSFVGPNIELKQLTFVLFCSVANGRREASLIGQVKGGPTRKVPDQLIAAQEQHSLSLCNVTLATH